MIRRPKRTAGVYSMDLDFLKPEQRLLTSQRQVLTAIAVWSQVSTSVPTSSFWVSRPQASRSRSLHAKMQLMLCQLPTWSWAWPPFSAVSMGEYTHAILDFMIQIQRWPLLAWGLPFEMVCCHQKAKHYVLLCFVQAPSCCVLAGPDWLPAGSGRWGGC